MSTVSFMPWCRIEKAYDVGEVKILPFERHKPLDGLDEAAQCRVNTILATYKTIEDRPVDSVAIVRYAEKSPIDDLSGEECETIHELVALACFCGLAGREYFNSLGSYCNSDCFNLYIQRFDKVDFTAIRTRRREGSTSSLWPMDDVAITVPVHCHTIRKVILDEVLLKALVEHRAQSPSEEWARWQNAISCFNQANTDGENLRYQVEWVLLCSTFEHLLGAKPDAKDVANRLSEIMVPREELPARDANRRSVRWPEDGRPLRYEWMREFYRIRGDFAHGRLNTQQPAVWNPLEHLVLATIAFPIVVRCLLKKVGLYELKDDDRTQIEAFERLADTTDFLEPPSNQQNSIDSHWARLCEDRKLGLVVQRVMEECESKGLLPRKEKGIAVEGDASVGQGE